MADPKTSPPLTPEGIKSAYSKIQPYIHKTPVLTSRSLSAIASSPDPSVYLSENPPPFPDANADLDDGVPQFQLYFKADNFQKIGAFKARGAFHAVLRLMDEVGADEVRKRGVVTHSSGNHAQALALAAWTFSIPSYIVMPKISTPSKIAGVRIYTKNVIFSGSTSQEREAVVDQVIAEHGAILVPPYDHPDIILGQGTSALELEGQVREIRATEEEDKPTGSRTEGLRPVLDAVITPLGGGGMLGGTATWFSETAETLVFGAEPSFQGGDDGRRGLEQGKRIESVKTLTIADGLRTPVGVVNWTILSDKSKVHAVYAVTEEEIKMALRLVLERVKVVVEPSAVVGLAVVLFNREFRDMVVERQRQREKGKGKKEKKERVWHMGVIFTGGNTTVKALSALFKDDEKISDKDERAQGTVGSDGSKKVENIAG
ncbi:hypothetical protein PV10_00528 [Exophiala mesophila]|uniref:Tryptophan synthase beta chain-like PALP domain-containing protein n=1 Tax=Exophiala mesophila TaxID=212818 RepID=A0A0D1ZRV9_EXOME|nr:uncharacterized protein PV10_00528 [Exophiala mesophila]KIV96699.1 hypothetical protein PV10_00528 [Exophiala mesophila]